MRFMFLNEGFLPTLTSPPWIAMFHRSCRTPPTVPFTASHVCSTISRWGTWQMSGGYHGISGEITSEALPASELLNQFPSSRGQEKLPRSSSIDSMIDIVWNNDSETSSVTLPKHLMVQEASSRRESLLSPRRSKQSPVGNAKCRRVNCKKILFLLRRRIILVLVSTTVNCKTKH